MKQPRLRDSKQLDASIFRIGEIPRELIVKFCGSIVYNLYTGRTDISGDDWGDFFAEAIGGTHLSRPIGIADVVKNNTAWSMKTVKVAHPYDAKSVRLISGRCSPDYSYGIDDPHADVQKTGEAVLAIWNSRVDIAHSHYGNLRTGVLVRDPQLKDFCFF